MKKMIIGIAAIALAFAANAAAVTWGISNVQTAGAVKLTSGYTYVFFTQGDAAAEIAAIKDLAGTGATKVLDAMSSANWNGTKKATAAGNFGIGTSAALGGVTPPTLAELGLAGGTTYSIYAVIFDTETITDDSKYIVTAAASVATPGESTSTIKNVNIGSQSANTNWMAVGAPEPTSGLLLLLGMAGLALKRKQA